MIFEGTIGSWQCIATLSTVTLIPLLLTLPTFSAEVFGTASFLHAVYISIVTGLLFLLLFKMYSKYKDKDILDISEAVGGKFLKYSTGALAIFYLLGIGIITLSEFNENIRNILFSEAPAEYISTLFMVAVFLGSIIGLKGIIRSSSIIAPLIIIGLISMFISLLGNIDLTNFTPIFGNGIDKVFLDGTIRFSRYESFALLFLVAPNIKNYGKTIFKSYLMVTFLILISFFLLFGILPFPSVTENYFPLFEISRLVSYGRFIQRVESIFILIWLVATFIYLSIGVTFTANIIKKLFNIKYYKRIIPSVSIIVLSR